jgi:hypothetical protein
MLRGVSVLVLVLSAACTSSGRAGPEPGKAASEAADSNEVAPSTSEPATEGEEGQEGQPEAPDQVDGFFMAEGAPPPRACTVDGDCIGDTIPDLEQPCCQNPRSLEPYARAYKRWLSGWRAEHCADLTCPIAPLPGMPRECAFMVVCVDGVCADTCNE